MKKKSIALLLFCSLAWDICAQKNTIQDTVKNSLYATGAMVLVSVIKSMPEIIKMLSTDPEVEHEKALKEQQEKLAREKDFIEIGPNMYLSKELFYKLHEETHAEKLRLIEKQNTQKI